MCNVDSTYVWCVCIVHVNNSEHVLWWLAPLFLMCLMFIENFNDTKWNCTHNAPIDQYPVTYEQMNVPTCTEKNGEKYCVSNLHYIAFCHRCTTRAWTPSLPGSLALVQYTCVSAVRCAHNRKRCRKLVFSRWLWLLPPNHYLHLFSFSIIFFCVTSTYVCCSSLPAMLSHCFAFDVVVTRTEEAIRGNGRNKNDSVIL